MRIIGWVLGLGEKFGFHGVITGELDVAYFDDEAGHIVVGDGCCIDVVNTVVD